MGKTIRLKDVKEDIAELTTVAEILEARKRENEVFYQLRPVAPDESILNFRGDVVASAIYHLYHRVQRLEKRVLELEGDA